MSAKLLQNRQAGQLSHDIYLAAYSKAYIYEIKINFENRILPDGDIGK